ncbi:MAG: hypothetical protein GXO87_13345 [Chlorobi bacterium]|nr:hypothetical protein [Chlorobiota bacterium]
METKAANGNYFGTIATKIITKREIKKRNPFLSNGADILNLSNISNQLKSFSLNASRSNVSFNGTNHLFQLDFNSGKSSSLNINGYFNKSFTKGEINVSYAFSYEEGKTENYRFDLNINSDDFRSFKESKHYEKEDIVKFIGRIANDLFKISRDKKKKLNGIIFNADDLEALASVGDKDIGKLVKNLISLIILMEQLDTKKKKKNTKSVTYLAERKLYEVKEREYKTRVGFDYSASLTKPE